MSIKITVSSDRTRRLLWHGAYSWSFLGAVLSLFAALPTPTTTARAEDEAPKVTYVDHVQPIFRQHCFACHGPDTKKNDLALDSYATAMAGGASGEALAAGDPDASYLWSLVNHDAEPSMPPGGSKLPQAELDVIKAWILGGLLEKGDSVARKPSKPAVAAFTPSADNRPAGEPAMPDSVSKEPVLHAPHHGAATSIAHSPWAPLAAVGTTFQVLLFHTDSGELLGVLPFLEGSPYVLQFSRDGGMLLVGGGRAASKGVVAVFDVKSGRRLATIGDELDSVLAADMSPDHTLVALGGPRKVIRVYRVADASLAYEITKHTDWATALEFSPDGKFLATADRSGGLWLWDAATGRERGELRGHTEQVTALSWRDDSGVLASASEDDTVRLWQPDGQQLKSWGAHGGGALSVDFNHEGLLVSAGRDRLVRTWKPDGAAIRDVATLDDVALAAAFSHDGKRVVGSDWRGNVRVFEAETGNATATLDCNPPLVGVALASLEAELNDLRTASTQADESAAAAQQRLTAAEEAVTAARSEAQRTAQEQSERRAKLQASEQRMQQLAAQKAALDGAEATLAEQTTATESQLAEAEQAALAARAKRDETQNVLAAQKSAVDALAAQLAELQKKIEAAQAALQPFVDALAAQDAEIASAEARSGELQATLDEIARRRAELEAIRELREKFGDGE